MESLINQTRFLKTLFGYSSNINLSFFKYYEGKKPLKLSVMGNTH